MADAARRALQKLDRPLSRLVGAEGYRALLRRALHLSRDVYPQLRDVQLQGVQPGALPALAASLDGLGTAVGGAGPTQAGDALAAVLTHLIRLLTTFIGSDLTARTVREVWPDVPDLLAPPDIADRNTNAERRGGETGAASEEATS